MGRKRHFQEEAAEEKERLTKKVDVFRDEGGGEGGRGEGGGGLRLRWDDCVKGYFGGNGRGVDNKNDIWGVETGGRGRAQ